MPLLTFKRDSAIEVSGDGDSVYRLDPDDASSLLTHMRSAVAFEPGLTTLGLMRCLSPWADIVGELGWFNFSLWQDIAEARKIRPASHETFREDGEPPIIEVVLRPYMRIHDDGYLNQGWDAVGKLEAPFTFKGSSKPDQYCAFELLPVEEWCGLPLRIDNACEIVRFGRKAGAHGDVLGKVQVETCLFDTVILGLFDTVTIFDDPDETNRQRENLVAEVESIEEIMKSDGVIK